MSSTAAILYGNSLHHLDHLAPLASLLHIPLIVDEKKTYSLAKKFYPHLRIIFFDRNEIYFSTAKKFDLLITCIPKPLFDVDFFLPQLLGEKKLQTIWCPHGNSDKGKASFFFEGLQKEEKILVYGSRMKKTLQERFVQGKFFFVGNYRYEYFLKHQKFYEELLNKDFFSSLDRKNQTILYAPTWNDQENSSSLEQLLQPLIDSLESNKNLIVKLHPNVLLTHPFYVEHLVRRKKKNLWILTDFPTIYPLLHLSDLYLGDMSSIGYDFLTFQKPMFFFVNQGHKSSKDSYFLLRCGHDLSTKNPSYLFKEIEALLPSDAELFLSKRKEVYQQTFTSKVKWRSSKTSSFFKR